MKIQHTTETSNVQENTDFEVFYDYSPQRKQYGIQVMKNGLFVGAPIWCETEDEAKIRVAEIKEKNER